MGITAAETLDGINYATTDNISRLIKGIPEIPDTKTFLDGSTSPDDFKLIKDTSGSEKHWIHCESDGTTRADISILCIAPAKLDNYRTHMSAKGNAFFTTENSNDTKVLCAVLVRFELMTLTLNALSSIDFATLP